MEKTKKRIAGYFIAVALMIVLFALAAAVEAADAVTSNEKAKMDFTDSNATGTVRINVVEKVAKRVKVTVEKGDKKYNYDLSGEGKAEFYPMQWGNGEYTVKVLIQASDPTKYSVALTGKFTLALKDEKAPYMNPSQFINYTKDTAVVKKAADLVKKGNTQIEKVEEMYKFVIQNLTYDTKKASTVQSGYVPDVDKVVSSGMGICFDYAAVFAAMLRSQGVPAKLVMGYVKDPNAKDPVYHAWNEVYLADKGWFKINEMKFDGKKFERIDPTFDSSSKSSKAVMKFIGDGSNYSKSWEF